MVGCDSTITLAAVSLSLRLQHKYGDAIALHHAVARLLLEVKIYYRLFYCIISYFELSLIK